MFFQDKIKQEYSTFEENFSHMVQQKRDQTPKERLKKKVTLPAGVFKQAQLDSLFDTFYLFMDRHTQMVNFWEVYNTFMVYNMRDSDEMVYRIFQKIKSKVEEGSVSSLMDYRLFIETLSAQVARDPQHLFSLLASDQTIAKEDLQSMLKQLDVPASSEQVQKYLQKTGGGQISQSDMVAIYQQYYP